MLDSFGTVSLHQILGYWWHEYISYDLVLRQAGLRQVTCIVWGDNYSSMSMWSDSLQRILPI